MTEAPSAYSQVSQAAQVFPKGFDGKGSNDHQKFLNALAEVSKGIDVKLTRGHMTDLYGGPAAREHEGLVPWQGFFEPCPPDLHTDFGKEVFQMWCGQKFFLKNGFPGFKQE
jgi:hypothetical protein